MDLSHLPEYEFGRYEPHSHQWAYDRMSCTLCGITAEEVVAGRDKPATWDDVDEAYNDGRRVGVEIGKAVYKSKRRQKLIEVGYYLAMRNFRKSLERE